MNVKYKKYIDYIVNDIQLPYLKSLDQYGLKQGEVVMVLSKLYDQPVTIKGNDVYDTNDNNIYYETSTGFWVNREYDQYGNEVYFENSSGFWYKKEYDANGNRIYFENSRGSWIKKEFDSNGNEIYFENSGGYIEDYR